jgi:hypothetical protein
LRTTITFSGAPSTLATSERPPHWEAAPGEAAPGG